MNKLEELKRNLLADGKIDADEVELLRKELYDDGVIDKEEANLLFELNDAVSGADNDSSWQKLFVDAITSYLLEDETSPGEVDADEAAWLIAKIGNDGKIDGVEKALLLNLKDKAKPLPDSLNELL